jgi:N-methylhydantoinase B
MMGRNEKYLSKAMSVWMGNQTPVLLSGQNQFGERFAYILIDSIAGGCGASSSHDGMDCAGDSYVVTLMIANIETHESTNPVLFLYRKRLRDSGGPGKYRGGLSMEECFIPYDTERLHLTALAHGVEVPNASGLFGGYPGCCSKFMLVKQADVTRKLGQGLPQSIEEMQREKVELPVCVPSMWIDRRDAFCYWWSGGGGFGDPLERDSDMVLTDVVNECISLDAAKDIYGVVIDDETGRVSADATTKVRQQMRMNRIRDRHDAH